MWNPIKWLVKRELAKRGFHICMMCDSIATQSQQLCTPCSYFFDEENRIQYEKDMLELAR
jgi:hypothetical protein